MPLSVFATILVVDKQIDKQVAVYSADTPLFWRKVESFHHQGLVYAPPWSGRYSMSSVALMGSIIPT